MFNICTSLPKHPPLDLVCFSAVDLIDAFTWVRSIGGSWRLKIHIKRVLIKNLYFCLNLKLGPILGIPDDEAAVTVAGVEFIL